MAEYSPVVELELDEEVKKLFISQELLFKANDRFGLPSIPKFKLDPITISRDTSAFSYNPNVQGLVDRVHQAAIQLKGHYEQIANDNPEFAAHWSQDPSFRQASDSLPEIKRRNFLESYECFLSRNRLEERLRIDKQLAHFSPFFSDKEYHKPVPSFEELKKACGTRWIIPTVVYGAIGGNFVYSLASYLTRPSEIGVFVTGFNLIFCPIILYQVDYICKEYEKKMILKRIRTNLSNRAVSADNAISLIHALAD